MYVLKQIQAPLEGRKVKKLSAKTVTNWLKAAGYLTVAYSEEVGKETTLPTAKGKELGIYTEVRRRSLASTQRYAACRAIPIWQ